MTEKQMDLLVVPVDGFPRPFHWSEKVHGDLLEVMQDLVHGYIEPFPVLFGDDIVLYVNDEGLFTEPPNRAIYATKEMEETGYLSQLDMKTPVQEGDLYGVLFGNIIAAGVDPSTGFERSLTSQEISQITDYFTIISKPGSGMEAVSQIRKQPQPSLSDREQNAREAAQALAHGDLATEPVFQDKEV